MTQYKNTVFQRKKYRKLAYTFRYLYWALFLIEPPLKSPKVPTRRWYY